MDTSKRGQAPYGFRWAGGCLLLDEAEAGTRREAFDLFLKLGSLGAAARSLNSAGHVTRRSGKWSDVQVARILECSSAIGRYETNRSAEDGAGQRRKTAKAERVTVECVPIVTRETWERVAELMSGKRAKRESPVAETTPLTGLVWCGCGERMSLPSGAKKFVCRKCPTQISADDLEAIFADDFAEAIGSHPVLLGALEVPSERREWMGEIAGRESELEDAAKQRTGAERMFAERAISKARFEELHAPLDKRVRELEAKLASLRTRLAADAVQPTREPKASWQSLWPSWPSNRRRRIIASFVSAFVIKGDEVEITYLLPDPSVPKETSQPQQNRTPTNQPQTGGPVYIRLPKPGGKCPITGLSRAKLNELILPNARNNFTPPVASKSLRQNNAQRGVRLVLLESLMSYLSGSV